MPNALKKMVPPVRIEFTASPLTWGRRFTFGLLLAAHGGATCAWGESGLSRESALQRISAGMKFASGGTGKPFRNSGLPASPAMSEAIQ